MRNAGKVAVVTGGASGIGLAFAQRWISDGGRAVLFDINEEALGSAANMLDRATVRPVQCDVVDLASVQAALSSVRAEEGRLDALMNGAGVIIPQSSAEVSDVDFERVVDVHLVGTFRLCREAYSLLKDSKGSIVNVTSVAARSGMPRRASYCAAKASLEGLTRTLAVEWARDGIRVNSVAPGYTKTEMTGPLIKQGKLNAERVEARTPLRRFAEASEIASAISFLFSEDASYITGHSLVVDGGMTIDGDWV